MVMITMTDCLTVRETVDSPLRYRGIRSWNQPER